MAFSPIGVSAWCIPVITMNGKVAARIPTIMKPSFTDRKLMATASPLPIIVPIGPTTIRAIGALIRITSVGFRISFTIFGVILSTRISI